MNSLILSGHLTKEIKLQTITTKDDTEITVGKGTIAVNNSSEDTLFFPFEIWGTKAIKLSELSTKGTRINLQGKLKQSTFSNSDNRKNIFTYMCVFSFEITDTKEITEQKKSKQEMMNNPFANSDKPSINDIDFDDDIPF
ncbi:single-stranded DNA-binding protein [Staphylococcus haemolyticus]|uniref:single-stranded DNA-binding protein n=1 Tax=Staphylococcus haemolyticus TaxID=1283 RepID=UPI001F0AF11D|nr:single-stranded DNA-binding protein [Staphylococcus haemolyticus]MCH4334919.1 single-stranded DNA-binding protein [Staphylococcus haemolyticus]